jgi:hypothetical protein
MMPTKKFSPDQALLIDFKNCFLENEESNSVVDWEAIQTLNALVKCYKRYIELSNKVKDQAVKVKLVHARKAENLIQLLEVFQRGVILQAKRSLTEIDKIKENQNQNPSTSLRVKENQNG